MSKNAFISMLANRLGASVFMFGKLLRFGFFLVFIIFLLKGTNTLAGYNLNQTLFFFLTFNLIDVVTQFLYREVYRFRPLVVSGSFDLVLTKPVNVLFRSLMGGADILDFMTIPPLILAIYFLGRSLNPTTVQVLLYLFLLINGLVIATAFHIAVLSLGIITLEIDHTIMIYRDLTNLSYLIPVGIMITLPAKALMGLVSPGGIVVSFVLGVVSLFLALRYWNFALTKYSSASS